MSVEFAQKAVIPRDGEYLLVRAHRMWGFPGGRLQEGETPDQALVREVREEVGLEVRPGKALAVWSWLIPPSQHIIAVARHCQLVGGTVSIAGQVPGDCIDDVGWFDRDAIQRLDLTDWDATMAVLAEL